MPSSAIRARTAIRRRGSMPNGGVSTAARDDDRRARDHERLPAARQPAVGALRDSRPALRKPDPACRPRAVAPPRDVVVDLACDDDAALRIQRERLGTRRDVRRRRLDDDDTAAAEGRVERAVGQQAEHCGARAQQRAVLESRPLGACVPASRSPARSGPRSAPAPTTGSRRCRTCGTGRSVGRRDAGNSTSSNQPERRKRPHASSVQRTFGRFQWPPRPRQFMHRTGRSGGRYASRAPRYISATTVPPRSDGPREDGIGVVDDREDHARRTRAQRLRAAGPSSAIEKTASPTASCGDDLARFVLVPVELLRAECRRVVVDGGGTTENREPRGDTRHRGDHAPDPPRLHGRPASESAERAQRQRSGGEVGGGHHGAGVP